MTLAMSLHGYLVNYGGLYNSVVIYLSKSRDFSSFQANLPAELTFLYPLRQQKFILMTLDCFRMTLGMSLHGYVVNYGGLYNSVVTYLLKICDFCSFQANLPPSIAFSLTRGHDEIVQIA